MSQGLAPARPPCQAGCESAGRGSSRGYLPQRRTHGKERIRTTPEPNSIGLKVNTRSCFTGSPARNKAATGRCMHRLFRSRHFIKRMLFALACFPAADRALGACSDEDSSPHFLVLDPAGAWPGLAGPGSTLTNPLFSPRAIHPHSVQSALPSDPPPRGWGWRSALVFHARGPCYKVVCLRACACAPARVWVKMCRERPLLTVHQSERHSGDGQPVFITLLFEEKEERGEDGGMQGVQDGARCWAGRV